MPTYSGNDDWHDAVTLPADNTRPTAANLNLVNEPVIDNERYLYNRGPIGAMFTNTKVSGGDAEVSNSPGTWQDIPASFGLVPYVTLAAEIGDVFLIDGDGDFRCHGFESSADIRIAVVQDYGGANVPSGVDNGTTTTIQNLTGDTQFHVPFCGAFTCTIAGNIRFKLQGRNEAGSPNYVGVPEPGSFRLRVRRDRPFQP